MLRKRGKYDDGFTLAEEVEVGDGTSVLIHRGLCDIKYSAFIVSLDGFPLELAPRGLETCDNELALVEEIELSGGTSVLIKRGTCGDKFAAFALSFLGCSIKFAPGEMGACEGVCALVEELEFGGGTPFLVELGRFSDKFVGVIVSWDGSSLEIALGDMVTGDEFTLTEEREYGGETGLLDDKLVALLGPRGVFPQCSHQET